MHYLIQSGAIASGPHALQSDAIRRATSCGNPELLSEADLLSAGVVLEVLPALGAGQGYGDPVLAADGLSVTRPVADLPPVVPQSVPARLAKLVLLASGWLGPSVTTRLEMDAAVLGMIDSLIPAGLQREAAKGAWLDSTQFESGNATLLAMLQAMGKTSADRDTLMIQADQMRQAEIAAQGGA